LGVVYKARFVGPGRTVALKMIRSGERASAAAEARRTLEKVTYLQTVQLAHREVLNWRYETARQHLQSCPPADRRWEWHYVDLLTRNVRVFTVRVWSASARGPRCTLTCHTAVVSRPFAEYARPRP
jgi:hypothetical protein